MSQSISCYCLTSEGSSVAALPDLVEDLVTSIRALACDVHSAPASVSSSTSRWKRASVAELVEWLDSQPVARLKESLLVLFLPGGQIPPPGILEAMFLSYPELAIRVISGEKEPGVALAALNGLLRGRVFSVSENSLDDLLASIESHLLGNREWFDPDSLRRRLRANFFPAERGADDGSRRELVTQWAYIIEDESEYRESLSYLAYRTGLFEVRTPRSAECLRRAFKELADSSGRAGSVLHARDIAFSSMSGTERKQWMERDHWMKALGGHALRRTWITGSTDTSFTQVDPRRDRLFEEPLLGWTEDVPPRVRALQKPLGWFHDILSSGALGNQSSDDREALLHAFFDGVDPVHAEAGSHLAHSAGGEVQDLAERLLTRAARALNEEEPLLASVMALDAARILRGHSATLFLDAVSLLSTAEAKAEVQLAAAAGGGAKAVEKRATELSALMDLLLAAKLARGPLVKGLKVRLWTGLRQVYKTRDAFDASEEALLELHRCEREPRQLATLRTWRPSQNGAWPDGRLLAYWLGELSVWRLLSRRLPASARVRIGYGQRLRDHAVVFAFAATLFVSLSIGVEDPWSAPAWFPWAIWIGEVATLLKASEFRCDRLGWVGAALRFRKWSYVAIVALLTIAASNWAILVSDGSHLGALSRSQVRERRPAYVLAWTAYQLLGAEVKPERLETWTKPKAAENEPVRSARFDLQFDPSDSVPVYLQWGTGQLAGWALFALGLSVIYRRATKG